jgi:glycerol kinase
MFGAAIPIRGVAGDQQAALFGQACFAPGDVKSTYGTGCFALVNTGAVATASNNRLLATAGYRAGQDGLRHRRQHLHRRRRGAMAARRAGRDPGFREIEALAARRSPPTDSISCRPSPASARPIGIPMRAPRSLALTRDMGVAEIARAALDAVCFQTRDLLDAMGRDMQASGLGAPAAMKVDGGMVKNDWFCQRLADLTGLAGGAPEGDGDHGPGRGLSRRPFGGVFADFRRLREAGRWTAASSRAWARISRDALYEGWLKAVSRTRS